jgi:hypothetical protein
MQMLDFKSVFHMEILAKSLANRAFSCQEALPGVLPKQDIQKSLIFKGLRTVFYPAGSEKCLARKKGTHKFQPLDRGPNMTISVGKGGQRVATLCPGLKRGFVTARSDNCLPCGVEGILISGTNNIFFFYTPNNISISSRPA